MDFFKVKCLACGKTFGLTETDIIAMTECRCPHCGQKMSLWQFCELKYEYYSLILKLHKAVSASLTPLPDVRFFAWELAEAGGNLTMTLLQKIKDLENAEETEI